MSDRTAAQERIASNLGQLYHNYSFFGVDNEWLPGLYEKNQKAKMPIIVAYIAHAIAKSRTGVLGRVSFTELFCADGFYTMIASRLGCDKCIGIDSDKEKHLSGADYIATLLGVIGASFRREEITPDSRFDKTDIVANIGGLYHVDSPEQVLAMSYRMARKFLIVQSVVSMVTDDVGYFESPAPGWSWGNRYSRQSFDRMIRRVCPDVVDYHFNELEGNDRLEDRGSVYYLIRGAQA